MVRWHVSGIAGCKLGDARAAEAFRLQKFLSEKSFRYFLRVQNLRKVIEFDPSRLIGIQR